MAIFKRSKTVLGWAAEQPQTTTSSVRMPTMTSSRRLFIDIETSSTTDLSKAGVYRYAESEDFQILLFAFSFDGDPVEVIDMKHFEVLPDFLIEAILDPDVIKVAHNAAFERICLSRYFRNLGMLDDYEFLDPEDWQCSMVHAATLGLPLSLDQLSQVLNLERPKLKEGRALIKMFCSGPIEHENPEKWQLFKEYNKRDVEAEIEIEQRLIKFPVRASIWTEYQLDQKINDFGVLVDINLAAHALEISETAKESLLKRLQEMTGLENPNSPSQMKEWLLQQNLPTDTLNQKAMKVLMEKASNNIRTVLALRNQLAMASVKKYEAMLNSACSDGRIRGMFQFYGAIRTGRYSGRIVQLQNLPRNKMPDLKEARSLVADKNIQALEMLYDDIPDTLSQLIRTALIAPDGKDFIVADFSAIEARVLSWLAEEEWRQAVFKENGDIYCETASRMFKVPVVKHGVNGDLRQKGKQAELACGYGGSVGAMKAMGALDFGMKEEELKPLVDSWREANPKIVKYWWAVDAAIKKAIRTKQPVFLKNLVFSYSSGILFIQLPSGRSLAYPKPKIESNEYGTESVTYMGLGLNKKWERLESYGPKFVENITQAISRDLLMNAMSNCQKYKIVAHVHDEIIVEADSCMSVETICQKMCELPPWANGLVLNAEGYRTPFYCKD
ncbi:DNA polymerase [Allobaculum mucilyticum]|uniref:DNA polymerase n=2 Tax=Allobaculum mucilyticum TaxID=2834459 RepID=UPI001F610DFD|nr:DNA polymerase [Allobaculum mucilyticum]